MITHDIALSAKQRMPFVNRVKSGPLSPSPRATPGAMAAARLQDGPVVWFAVHLRYLFGAVWMWGVGRS